MKKSTSSHTKFTIFYSILSAIIIIAYVLYSFIYKTKFLTYELVLMLFSTAVVYVWNDITKLKLGKDGIELEKTKVYVDKAIMKFAHGKLLSTDELNTLFESLELNDWSKLILARMLLRKGLVTLLPDHGLGDSPSLTALIKIACDRNVLGDSDLNSIDKLRNVTYYAEWWSGSAPTYEEWNWAIENARSIVISLFNKQRIV